MTVLLEQDVQDTEAGIPYMVFPNGPHGPRKVFRAHDGREAKKIQRDAWPHSERWGLWVRCGSNDEA